MRISDLHLTVGVTTDGKAACIYLGADALEAGKAFREAGPEFAQVETVPFLQGVFQRRPVEEPVPIKFIQAAKEIKPKK